ncbi:MAG: 2-phosphosulfolactate phosphatase [Frankiales bacterium]|nr:2-phosphosulfolactate phosphatase [Frankiales bacterium]
MTVRVEWGPAGVTALAAQSDVLVVVDVLSFSTVVSVAVASGVSIWPHPWRDGTASVRARELGAVLAGTRGEPGSLSPASVAGLPPGTDVLLPSPNGATICVAAAAAGTEVVAGCLRNAPAVAEWLADREVTSVGVIPAGERWPDDTLRPAYEDWLGAGALVSLLDPASWSAEAAAAAAAWSVRRPLREVASGIELVDRGFVDDVDAAEAYGADAVVPLLVDGRFTAVTSAPP